MPSGKDSLYEEAFTPRTPSQHPGEPVTEDGYVPRNRYAKPHWSGIIPDIFDTSYPVIKDPVIIKKKQEMRQALKEEYKKQIYNPYKFAASPGGVPFDTGIHRYITLLRTQAQFLRPSFRMTFLGLCVYVFPIAGMSYFLIQYKEKQEAILRSGQIAYKDRDYKFMI